VNHPAQSLKIETTAENFQKYGKQESLDLYSIILKVLGIIQANNAGER